MVQSLDCFCVMLFLFLFWFSLLLFAIGYKQRFAMFFEGSIVLGLFRQKSTEDHSIYIGMLGYE